MDIKNMVAMLLIAGGAFGLAYGGFSYTKETHKADIGGVHLSIDETQRVNVPLWAGIGAIAMGTMLLVLKRRND